MHQPSTEEVRETRPLQGRCHLTCWLSLCHSGSNVLLVRRFQCGAAGTAEASSPCLPRTVLGDFLRLSPSLPSRQEPLRHPCGAFRSTEHVGLSRVSLPVPVSRRKGQKYSEKETAFPALTIFRAHFAMDIAEDSQESGALLTKPFRLRSACNQCHAAKASVGVIVNMIGSPIS